MKSNKQSAKVYARLADTISKENRPPELIEDMLIKDIERVLKSYFIYQNEDVEYLFLENKGKQEFCITLKYRNFKDIKVL